MIQKYWWIAGIIIVGIFLYQRGILSSGTVESFKTWLARNISLGQGKGYLDF